MHFPVSTVRTIFTVVWLLLQLDGGVGMRQKKTLTNRNALEKDIASQPFRNKFSGTSCTAALRPAIQQLNVRELFNTSGWFSYWAGAKEVKVMKGFDETWENILSEAGFEYERKRLDSMKRLNASDMKLRGACDFSMETMTLLSKQPKILEMLYSKVGMICGASNASNSFAAQAVAAWESECLDECTQVVYEHAQRCHREQCHAYTCFTNYTFTPIMQNSKQCTELPWDTVEQLAQRSMWKRCNVLGPPSPLWTFADKAPGSVETMGPDAVCTVSAGTYVQNGTCPEGSKCKCPMTEMWDRPTAEDTRGMCKQHEKKSWGCGGADMWNGWVQEGSASFSSFASQYVNGFLGSVLIGELAFGGAASLSAAVMAVLAYPQFAVMGTVVLTWTNLHHLLTFKCEDTVGCWPDRAVMNSTVMGPKVCRMPEKSRDGGSPIWFMPPPGLKTHKTWNGNCVLDSCTINDWMSMSVGVHIEPDLRMEGKPIIKNCQPLSWEDMGRSQRQYFLKNIIATGIEAEYSLAQARKEANMIDFQMPGLGA